MREFLSQSLHIFIVLMIFVLGIGGALVTGGAFDNWGKRMVLRKNKKKLHHH